MKSRLSEATKLPEEHPSFKEHSVDISINAKGLECPIPVILTKKALKKMSPSQVLEIQCTDPMSEIDIPVLLFKTEDDLIEVRKLDSEIISFFIRKK